jgi:hypothetical protein
MNCEQIDSLIARLAVNDPIPDRAESSALARHLGSCGGCRAKLAEFRRTVALLHEASALPGLVPKPVLSATRRAALRRQVAGADQPPALRFPVRRVAAAAAVALLAFAGYSMLAPSTPRPGATVAQNSQGDPLAADTGEKPHAASSAIAPPAEAESADAIKGSSAASRSVSAPRRFVDKDAEEKARRELLGDGTDGELQHAFDDVKNAAAVPPPVAPSLVQKFPAPVDNPAVIKPLKAARDPQPNLLPGRPAPVQEAPKDPRLTAAQERFAAERADASLPPANSFTAAPVNLFVDPDKQPVSSFPLIATTERYAIAARFLLAGQLPPPAAIHVEDFVNAMSTGYSNDSASPIRLHVDTLRPSPFGDKSRLLLRVVVQAQPQASVGNEPAPLIVPDAAIKIEFSSLAVRRYRLIGYDRFNPTLADQATTFKIFAGTSVTALYELELTEPSTNFSLGEVRLTSFRGTRTAIDLLNPTTLPARTEQQKTHFLLAAAAAEFGEILRRSPHAQPASLPAMEQTLKQIVQLLPQDVRAAELLDLVQKTRTLMENP